MLFCQDSVLKDVPRSMRDELTIVNEVGMPTKYFLT